MNDQYEEDSLDPKVEGSRHGELMNEGLGQGFSEEKNNVITGDLAEEKNLQAFSDSSHSPAQEIIFQTPYSSVKDFITRPIIKRRTGYALAAGALFVLMGFAALSSVLGYFAEKLVNEQETAYKVAMLERRVSLLTGQVKSVSTEQALADLSLEEIKNREVVKQQSQDELLTAAVSKVSPSVVSIVVTKDVPKLEIVYKNPFGDDPLFKDFGIKVPVYQQRGTVKQRIGAGTGFIIKSDGYVLTNKHVVYDDKADYTVLLSDGSQKQASAVYRSPGMDIALLKIEGKGYRAASFGNSDSLKLGQTVVAIGNALGEYNNSVSIGVISGLDRSITASGPSGVQTLSGVIQTDASINPGNSGGPLIDLNGQVVGVNVATVIGSNNISFSIPVNSVKPEIANKK
jgi:S1-C subfamily serine protease